MRFTYYCHRDGDVYDSDIDSGPTALIVPIAGGAL